MASEARRLERLVRDLLDLAKLDARAFSLDVRPTDLWDVVRRTAEGFQPMAEGLGLHVVVHEPVVELAGPVPQVAADGDRLAQVVANLVENALRFGQPPVQVDARAVAGAVTLTVLHHGAGVDPALVPKLFSELRPLTGRPRRSPWSSNSACSG